jgi:hypothetical protein
MPKFFDRKYQNNFFYRGNDTFCFASNNTFKVPMILKLFCSAIFLPFFSSVIKIVCAGFSSAKAMVLASPASRIRDSSFFFAEFVTALTEIHSGNGLPYPFFTSSVVII